MIKALIIFLLFIDITAANIKSNLTSIDDISTFIIRGVHDKREVEINPNQIDFINMQSSNNSINNIHFIKLIDGKILKKSDIIGYRNYRSGKKIIIALSGIGQGFRPILTDILPPDARGGQEGGN